MNDKINELMATEVMGWEFFEYKDPFDSRQDEYREDGLIGKILFKHLWNPTTDMNQAMECLIIFNPEHFHLHKSDNGESYSCHIFRYRESLPAVVVLDNLAPLAICKAILKAKGIDANI